MSCEDGCRDWSEESRNQGMTGIAGNPQKLVERTDSVLQSLQKGTHPTDTLILDF